MKAVIITTGSRGDIAPFTGLAARLRAAGHDVAIATQAAFADLVRAAGCEFRLVPGDVRADLASTRGQDWQRRGTGRLGALRTNIEMGRQLLADVGRGVVAAAEGADVLLLQRTALVHGYLVATATGVPGMALELFPGVPSADFALPSLGVELFGRWGNRALPRLAFGLGKLVRTPLDDTVRDLQRELGLPRTSLAAVRAAMLDDPAWPIRHGFSQAIVPRPADWRPGVTVDGYWWPPAPPEDWRPPAELADFLAAGPPPVFVGFGSMSHPDGAALAETVTSALRRARVRAVVQAGWSGLAGSGDDVCSVGDVPHEWLFPRMAAVVHHAGAGTTGAGLRAGVPAVPVAVLGDQPFWARRLVKLGVSPGWLPLRGLTADRLAELIRRAVTDESHRRRAQAVAERVRAEDGAGRIVAALRHLDR
ncbi:glycosyltransferase [Goodfellowiella coeruleoviolacea]|uniref:UDP:flavonoid glycosyltransferase YjiC, YdhE family n=1 Tax=Goodfellowiella coeruleoviolacea TaxID=334858 RepID=A0AAE3GL56_9PSEU|nr:glycosyltransferase [Goodfellowiella coeruleoviolacea]MCP2170221.1 UDP:flavonoid glycosyltransferase YjiC, YdhE family [Goodfellowiella coeruleoviolacea]